MNELQNFNFEGNEAPVKLVNDQLAKANNKTAERFQDWVTNLGA